MRILGEVDVVRVDLRFTPETSHEIGAKHLRGALASRFPENDLFHQHGTDGQASGLAYRYPLIQYRWDGGTGEIVGFTAGAQPLLDIPWLDLDLRLGNHEVLIQEARLDMGRSPVAVTDRLLRYRFRTPWIPLNQENHRFYSREKHEDRMERLDKLLTNHILAALQGLSIRFPERLYAAVCRLNPTPSRYKKVSLLGFEGEFVANALLPRGLGIGKTVSHGYGAIERITPVEFAKPEISPDSTSE